MSIHQEAAERALNMINYLGKDAQSFICKWIGFAAFYEIFDGNDERTKLMNAVSEGLSEDAARGIIQNHHDEIDYLMALPPGDLRYSYENPRFRKQTEQDIYRATNQEEPLQKRVGFLIAVIYQVRNNLIHGAKDPSTLRSIRLFEIADQIMGSIIEALVSEANAA